jgi:hypothetical protein
MNRIDQVSAAGAGDLSLVRSFARKPMQQAGSEWFGLGGVRRRAVSFMGELFF